MATKEQVRQYMFRRWADRSPVLSIEETQVEVGWREKEPAVPVKEYAFFKVQASPFLVA